MIDFYKKEHRHRPHDQALAKEYVKSLKEIKTAADRASQNEDFANAGKTYSVLLKNFPYFKDFAQDLSFDKDQLSSKVTTCKTALYHKGFQEYRAGNLNEAISLWQGYLTYRPPQSGYPESAQYGQNSAEKPSTIPIVRTSQGHSGVRLNKGRESTATLR